MDANELFRPSVVDSVRIADRQRDITNPQVGSGSDRDGGQLIQFDAQYGEIGILVHADHRGLRTAAVLQQHLDFVGAGDDVIIGKHIALRGNDNTGTQAGLGALERCTQLVTEKMLEQRVVEQRVTFARDDFGGVDIDDSPGRGLDRIRVGCGSGRWRDSDSG